MELHRRERQYPAYISLDVHKNIIACSVAKDGRRWPEYQGEIARKARDIAKLVERLNCEFDGEILLRCYEAGSSRFDLHRRLLELGQKFQVVRLVLPPLTGIMR